MEQQAKQAVEAVKESVSGTQEGVEPPSGEQGKGTVNQPYDGGNAPENPPSSKNTLDSSTESSSTEHQGSGLPQAVPSAAQEQAIRESKEKAEAAQKSPSSPSGVNTSNTPGKSAQGKKFDASKAGAGDDANDIRNRKISTTRSISPGTRVDGTHAKTAAARGETYEPGVKDKIKGFFRRDH